ncbi:hypothetical protein HNR06_002592 [Nocardiopsis arvandica]|uniref:Lipoprotein n=1 Tax=Nocardiopsis sinuspersici TaxID=501010 RepID=A0A7Y9XC60_9ACTN|nr:hypothetical protein [Nocardiopsis sinuspersici]NYH53003.1 hypothetical protein [Nocardiopsis sinuspersici]
MTTAKTPAAVSLAALLTLTACSGGSSFVYDFTEPMTEPASSIEFRIPDELIELEDGYAEERVYESITVSAVDSDDGAGCAVEYEFDFVDGGLERYLENQENNVGDAAADTTFDRDATLDERMASRMTGWSLDEIELSEDYTSAVVPLDCAASPTDDESTSHVYLSRVDGDDAGSLAKADVSIMQGGELYVHESEVYNWQLDSNGNWIQADE